MRYLFSALFDNRNFRITVLNKSKNLDFLSLNYDEISSNFILLTKNSIIENYLQQNNRIQHYYYGK